MRELLEKYYIENHGRLVKILSNRAGGIHCAEDVVHDAFERALRYRNSFEPSRQELGAWFNTIMNNALRDYKKAERMMGMSVEYVEELDEGLPMQDWEDDMICAVLSEIDKKNVMVRQALYLYFFKQYKPREISQILDMSNCYIRTSVKEFKQSMVAKYGG
jgi:RNA polymerase sigma factor (sigma-70 family)